MPAADAAAALEEEEVISERDGRFLCRLEVPREVKRRRSVRALFLGLWRLWGLKGRGRVGSVKREKSLRMLVERKMKRLARWARFRQRRELRLGSRLW